MNIMIDIKESLKKFKKLLEFTETEFEVCPWIADLTFQKILSEIKSEIKEVETADSKTDVSLELGDLLRDVLLAIFIAQRDLETFPLEKILDLTLKKVKLRKPWVLEKRKITKEEAVEIWNSVKRTQRTTVKDDKKKS